MQNRTGVVGVTGTTYAAQNDKIISSNISVNNKVNKVLLFEDFENGNHFLRTRAIHYGTITKERLQIPIVKGDTYVLKYDDRNHSGSYPMYVPDVTIDGIASVFNSKDYPWRIPGDNWEHVELTFVATRDAESIFINFKHLYQGVQNDYDNVSLEKVE